MRLDVRPLKIELKEPLCHDFDHFPNLWPLEETVGFRKAIHEDEPAPGVDGALVGFGFALRVGQLPLLGHAHLLRRNRVVAEILDRGQEQVANDGFNDPLESRVRLAIMLGNQASYQPAMAGQLLFIGPTGFADPAQIAQFVEVLGQPLEDLPEPGRFPVSGGRLGNQGKDDASLPVPGPAMLVSPKDLPRAVPVSFKA